MANIQKHIENLRAKPEHIRKQIAFWASLAVTLIIFAFWLGSITGVNNSAGAAVAEAVGRAGSPAGSMLAGVGSFFKDIKEIIFTPKRVTYSTVEARPGK